MSADPLTGPRKYKDKFKFQSYQDKTENDQRQTPRTRIQPTTGVAMGLFDTTIGVEMVYITCIDCGVLFGFPIHLQERLRQNHKNFYCPNGHAQCYLGKTEAEKLRDEKVRLQAQLDQSNARADSWRARQEETERSLRSTKGVVTRIKKRVAEGKCACCSKKFPDLEAHMKTAHPDWTVPVESASA